MLRRVTMAAVIALVTAAMVVPAALAQDDYSTTQVEYGQDVYSGTEGGAETGASGSTGASAGAWTKFTAKLSGDNEVGGGDPDGGGTAAVKTRGTEVCYDLKWTGVDVTLAHIHKGASGANGDVVVNFFANESPLDASSKSGCVTAKEAVVKGLASNPGNYYVNLHSPEYPKGAVRGQTALLDGNQLPYTGGPMSKGLMLLGLSVIAAGSTLLAVGQRRRVATHRPRH
jgi:hypothetical protein